MSEAREERSAGSRPPDGGAIAVAGTPAAPEAISDAIALDPEYREGEDITALIIGFGTGLSIGLIFLVYIVLEAAKLLP